MIFLQKFFLIEKLENTFWICLAKSLLEEINTNMYTFGVEMLMINKSVSDDKLNRQDSFIITDDNYNE